MSGITDQKNAGDALDSAFPGNSPSSPNEPGAKAARERAAAEEVIAIQNARQARRNEVARGDKD